MHRSIVNGNAVYHPYTRDELRSRIRGAFGAAADAANRNASVGGGAVETRSSCLSYDEGHRLQQLLDGWES